MGRKLRGCVPLYSGEELGPHLTRCRLGRGLPLHQLTKWHPDPSNRLATIHQRYRQAARTERRMVP